MSFRAKFPWARSLPCCLLAAACAGTTSPATLPGPNDGADADRIAELQREQAEQTRRVGELEARLKLLEAEARRSRGAQQGPGESLRTSAVAQQSSGAPEAGVERASADDAATQSTQGGGRERPALRLHGRARGAARADSAELPPLPITNERLAVVPLPEAGKRRALAANGGDDAAPAAVSDAATSDYRSALRLLRERRFDAAVLALSRFVADNPDHALVDRAVYWSAEARYAKREYQKALSEFETVLERFPRSEKAPDSLFKMGMCFRHLGVPDQARVYFQRVQAEYPSSEAAGLASREDST